MAFIIDRRENPKGKNLGNRQRFVRRAKDQIREAVKNSIKDKNLKDLTAGDNIKVPVRDLRQPSFSHDSKIGKKNYVLPGNKEFVEDDKVPRPPEGGGGGGGSQGSPDGEGEDDFAFNLTKEEFMDIFFEDLELPNLVKHKLKDDTTLKNKRSGYTNSGNPINIDVRQTAKLALARRIALKRPADSDIEDLEGELEQAYEDDEIENVISTLQARLDLMQRRMKIIPWIDPIDVRFRNFVPKPVPNVQAVMFAVMDVSASMGEREKDIAKRFFLLLYLFLTKKYKKVQIVFIRHTHEAQEVDEETFFHDKTTGGTIVSTALEEISRIVKERYSVSEWNIYVAQASDGDNYSSDSEKCVKQLSDHILPICQYMAYIEITSEHTTGFHIDKDLWKCYTSIEPNWENLQMKKIANVSQIYPVFRQLFSKVNE